MELLFLGTGGGRNVVVNQWRATGGILVKGSLQVLIDPGPGSLLRILEAKENPTKTDVLLVSHAHIDHSNDVNIMVEAITSTGKRSRGFVAGSESVLIGDKRFNKVITNYHESMLAGVRVMKPGESAEFGDLKVAATKTVHGDPSGIGFILKMDSKILGYSGDTEYFPGLGESFKGCDVLVLNNLVQRGDSIPTHMSTDGAAKVAAEAKPGLLVLNHFGMGFLRAGPAAEARFVEDSSGVKTIAATDGFRLNLGSGKGSSLFDFK